MSNKIRIKTILIVEDDEYSSKFFSEVLKNYEYELIFCQNAEDSIELVKENKEIDLILMDIKLPGKDGLYATQIIKSLRKELPIIVQTAYAMVHDEEIALESGCDAYLSKPIIVADLVATIEQFI